MKKLVMTGLVGLLILFGSGWVDVNIKGNQKYLTEPVWQMIGTAADLVDDWASTINLKVQNVPKKEGGYAIPDKNFEEKHAKALEEYNKKVDEAQKFLDEGKTDKYNEILAKAQEELERKGYHFVKTYDGFRHVLLVGTIIGENGQKEQIVIDVDTGRDVTSGVTVIGSDLIGKGKKQVAVDRDATVQNGVLNIERDVSTSGQFNSTNFMTIWRNNASVSTSVATITGDNVTTFTSVSAQGSGNFGVNVTSDNFINQQSHTAIAVSGNQKKGKNK